MPAVGRKAPGVWYRHLVPATGARRLALDIWRWVFGAGRLAAGGFSRYGTAMRESPRLDEKTTVMAR